MHEKLVQRWEKPNAEKLNSVSKIDTQLSKIDLPEPPTPKTLEVTSNDDIEIETPA